MMRMIFVKIRMARRMIMNDEKRMMRLITMMTMRMRTMITMMTIMTINHLGLSDRRQTVSEVLF